MRELSDVMFMDALDRRGVRVSLDILRKSLAIWGNRDLRGEEYDAHRAAETALGALITTPGLK